MGELEVFRCHVCELDGDVGDHGGRDRALLCPGCVRALCKWQDLKRGKEGNEEGIGGGNGESSGISARLGGVLECSVGRSVRIKQ